MSKTIQRTVIVRNDTDIDNSTIIEWRSMMTQLRLGIPIDSQHFSPLLHRQHDR